uniref:ABC transporter substrate-binding protein n=1 Tax=Tetragenococcus halophilus TaxID=51669 RepID=UPI0024E16474|nr:ABC transporter substrate-binding protein [Tetragenococcus halophilus]
MSALFFSVMLTSCSSSNEQAADGVVEIELFSYKGENINILRDIIEDFEEEYPEISVDFQSPPDPITVLRSRLVRDDVPDVMSLGGDATYGEFADAGILADLTDEEFMSDIQPSYIEMLRPLVGENITNDYGVPYAANADGVIYNKRLFNELDMEVPRTWSEFIELLDTAQDQGVKPIEFALNDAWTGLPMWNALASILVDDDFHIEKERGEASFQNDYREVAEKMLQLLEYGEGDIFGSDYDTGNINFINDGALFYFQINSAIPDMLNYDPHAELGIFPLPATDDPEQNSLTSGVDMLFAMSEETDHKEEALTFINYLMRPEVNQKYVDDQITPSTLEDVLQESEIFDDLQPYFIEDDLTSFPDHYYPAALGEENLIQDFLINKDIDSFLESMDEQW